MFRKILFVLLCAAATALAQEATPAKAPLTVDDVVREVLANHPAAAATRVQLEAQRQRVALSGALADPTVTVSYMGDLAPFRTQANDPSSYRGISAMQMLPLGGKRELRRAMARAEVHAGEAEQLAVARRLKADAEAAYYDYYYYGRALEVTARNKSRLEQMEATAEARYRVGKAMQSEVLRAQLEISMLLQRQATLEQQRETAAARLNLLMGRAMDAELPAAADVVRAALPELPRLLAAAVANDPMLRKEQTMVERNTVAITMAHKEYVPDLAVGYMYQQRSGMPDMYGAQFSVNVPVFYKTKQREAEAAAKLDLSASEKTRDARKLDVAWEVKQMHAMAANAAKMLDLYDQAILPQARLTLESAESAYGVGGADLMGLMGNITAIHTYQLDYYRQLADYQTALARIAALTGDLAQIAPEVKQ